MSWGSALIFLDIGLPPWKMLAALCSKWLCMIKQVRWLFYLIYKLLWLWVKTVANNIHSESKKHGQNTRYHSNQSKHRRKAHHFQYGQSKVICLAAEWLHTLFGLYWNYGKEGRGAMSWVKLKTDDALQAALKAPKAACTPTVSQNMTQRISSPCEELSLQTCFEFLSNLFCRFSGSPNIVTALSIHAAEGHFFVFVHFDDECVCPPK